MLMAEAEEGIGAFLGKREPNGRAPDMTMEPRLTLVTLGVADIARSKAFYEALGFKPCGFESPDVAFYDAGGVVLGLFGRKPLAHDADVPTKATAFAASRSPTTPAAKPRSTPSSRMPLRLAQR